MNTDMAETYDDGHTARDIGSSLRNRDRPKFTSKVILDLLDENKATGLTISQISELTGFSRDTVAKHLEVLVASREAYKVEGNSGLYHKNGRVAHYKNMESSMFGKRMYSFYYLNNPEGDFVFIQEKEMGRFRTIETKGGIMVRVDDFKRFMAELSTFTKEALEIEKKKE